MTNFHTIEGPITRDKIACYSFYSFLVEVHTVLAIYMLRMRKSNVEIRIVGSSGRLQLTLMVSVWQGNRGNIVTRSYISGNIDNITMYFKSLSSGSLY